MVVALIAGKDSGCSRCCRFDECMRVQNLGLAAEVTALWFLIFVLPSFVFPFVSETSVVQPYDF